MFNLLNVKLKKLCFILLTNIFCYTIVQVLILLYAGDEINFPPVLTWWSQFVHLSNDRLISCYNDAYKCLVTTNHTRNIDAYLFYGSHIENHNFPLPRNYNIPWAIFHEESPKNYAPFLFEETQQFFNVTSTFSRYSDFPVTLQYLENTSSIRDLKYYVPIDIKNKYLNEIATVLYIQSDCDTPLNRDYLVRELGKFVTIDSYGKCVTNKEFPKEFTEVDSLDIYNEVLLHFISKYKFIIAFENSICEDYITEKLWRPLIVGSVPIYLGSPTIEDWLPNKNSAILVKNYNGIEDVANYIKDVNANDTLYESFLEHKLKSKISNDLLDKMLLKDHPIPDFECFICKQLHEPNVFYKKSINVYNCPKPNVLEKENTWYQHWEIGKCQSKALKKLLERNKPYSSDLFEETWKTLFYEKKC